MNINTKSKKRSIFAFWAAIAIIFATGGCDAKDSIQELPNVIIGDEKEIPEKEGLYENPIIKTADENVSTFSIDIDTASYVSFRSNISKMTLKEFQEGGYTIRTEEAINYFKYGYEKPTGEHPIAVTTSVGECSWNNDARLAVITVAGKTLEASEQKGSNIVFLIDVSGSMSSNDKLPLLKESLKMAIGNLNDKDTVSMVTYASGVKTVLSGAKGSEKDEIIEKLNSLTSGGSTAGASGLELAYSVAQDYFIENGNNRVIIATDGDFNVGPSSVGEMKSMITQKRESGIFLTVLGFGVTNYYSGDERLETLADNGNGGFYIIDGISEGEKVLCEQFTGTLYTVAKDVKMQVTFNKDTVESYRLIGYENRVLLNSEFEDDSVDAGDLGAGQTVTAIYEIVLKNDATENLFTVSARYKEPNSETSKQYDHTAKMNEDLGGDFYFASAVAEACLIVNNSTYKGNASLEHACSAAYQYSGNDVYRKEFADILNGIKSQSTI